MSDSECANKCVIVIDQALPVGVIANTAAVLALSIGKQFPELIGRDMLDGAGHVHRGITQLPIPVLKGTRPGIKEMRDALKAHEPQVAVVDLISATQTTRSYDEYALRMEQTPHAELDYLGVALYGPTRIVNRFSGSLGLLR